jgi:hypothetical protein
MALAEFEPSRRKTIEEVNGYLKENYGVDSYKRILPALLLQKRPDEPQIGVYPLVPTRVDNPDNYWGGIVFGSTTSTFGVVRIQDRGFYLKAIGRFDESEWRIKRPWLFAKGVFNKQVRILRKLIDRPVHFLGLMEDLFTNEEREVYIVDFDPHYSAGGAEALNCFMAAKWLKDNTASRGLFWPGDKRPVSQIIPLSAGGRERPSDIPH